MFEQGKEAGMVRSKLMDGVELVRKLELVLNLFGEGNG